MTSRGDINRALENRQSVPEHWTDKRRIAELEADLDWYRVNCTQVGPCSCNYRAVVAEARLTAVIAVANTFTENNILRETIIAAATGTE